MTRVKSLGGHPIEQYSSPNVGGAMDGHKGLVLHIAEGTYRGTISWQMNPDQRYASGGSVTTSSTWVVGRQTGEWAQMVDTDRIAWCQRGGSRDWNSVELAGHAPGAPTQWQIEACAQLLAWHHRQYGTPLAVADNPGERGLGHHSMDREWLGEEWGHDSCPGSGVIAAKAAIVKRAQAIVAGEDDDMTPEDMLKAQIINPVTGKPAAFATFVQSINTGVYQARQEQQAATAAILGAVKGLDTVAILAEIRTVAAAEQQRDQALAELVRAGQSGELAADEVLRRLGELLTAGTTAQQAG